MTELFEKSGIQYLKNLMRESYQEKRIAFENFLENQKGITLENFSMKIFRNKCFNDSNIPKADFIVQLLNDEIRIDYWIFLRKIFRNISYLTDRRAVEEFIHPIENRAISVREAARLQSFPDNHRFFGSMKDKYKQVGNAVPPLMAQAIAKAVEKILG